jgi:hypothetical protein
MDIVVWPRSLGLGKCEAAFRENEIDETVLPSLTHEKPKELGVTSLGHRVKLLEAIAALRSDASSKAPSVSAVTTSSAPSAHPEDRASWTAAPYNPSPYFRLTTWCGQTRKGLEANLRHKGCPPLQAEVGNPDNDNLRIRP